MEWLEKNKEWFLSGAGIFIISSIVSFASVILTLWWKSRIENKKNKKLCISISTTKFSVPSSDDTKCISPDHIKVTYKGNEYGNLCVYTVQIANIGTPAIENQKLHFTVPIGSKIIEVFENKNLESIKLTKEEIENTEKKEIVYEFSRLETNDVCKISYLLDIEDVALISCEPRGVDNIEYSHKDDVEKSEIDKIVIYIATFVFADMVPFIGDFLQGLIIIISSQMIIKIVRKYIKSKRLKDNVLHIWGDIKVDENGQLIINQAAM